MARKAIPAARKASPATTRGRTASVSTPVRNSAVPKVSASAAVRRDVPHDQIAKRAYEIWLSGTGGSQEDNWLRAERELRG